MKLADIDTDTVYALQGSKYDTPKPVLVLDTVPWTSGWNRMGNREELHRDPNGKGYYAQNSYSYSRSRGLLAVKLDTHYSTQQAEWAFTTADAVKVVEQLTADPTAKPTLPEGHKLVVIRPQTIVRTWAEETVRRAASKKAMDEHRAHLAEQSAKNKAAMDHIRRLVGDDVFNAQFRHATPDYAPRIESWQDLEKLINAARSVVEL